VIRPPSKDSEPKDSEPKNYESGAALVLALGFVLLVGAISAGLLSYISTTSGNTVSLNAVRNRQYAADGTIEQAIALHRAALDNDPNAPCNNPIVASAQIMPAPVPAIRVDCFLAPSLVAAGGHFLKLDNVIFRACDASLGDTCSPSNTIVETQVNFAHSGSSPVSQTYIQAWSVNR
jgi:hypothetical protein